MEAVFLVGDYPRSFAYVQANEHAYMHVTNEHAISYISY